VDVQRVVDEMSNYPGVVHAEDYRYLCSEPGQALIREAIRNHRLDAVVVTACTPSLHEGTFRRTVGSAGLNPYQCEIANIREQCSWVHEDREVATRKAIRIIKGMVEKAVLDESLEPIAVPVVKRALVIGAGIAGIQAALDIANSGLPVTLLEREPSIGGRMAQLSETFPTLDCSQCILTPRMAEVAQHPNIELLTCSEVVEVTGHVGNFKARILKHPRYVIEDKCNNCGDCARVCPVLVPNEFDRGLSQRTAIYIPFPQAVPSAYMLDAKHCLGLFPLACERCATACEAKAIDYDMRPQVVEREVGAILVATGYDLYSQEHLGEYGYGQYADVIDSLQFERMLSASGPTGGEIRRPSDGRVPREVVFIQCAGSRDPETHFPYCSKICCMYTAKHAMLFKHKGPDRRAYIFYMDVRAAGKGYEEFIQRVTEEDRVLYIRGRVARVFQEGAKLMVWGVDTLSGRKVEIAADLVVLAMAMVPNQGAEQMARMLRLAVDEFGFFKEAHPKLQPVETLTAGVGLAGAAQAPRDISETVAQASGAAVKMVSLLSRDQLTHEPIIAGVDEDLCSGCGICLSVCPYGARVFSADGRTARVIEVLCEGCGACSAACPSGAAEQRNFTDAQILKMVSAAVGE